MGHCCPTWFWLRLYNGKEPERGFNEPAAEPGSLILDGSIVYSSEARYFPDCDFKDATLGHRPSWIWRSLLAGRDTVMNNARRQIMNGEGTSIWADNWVPEVGIITPLVPIPINAPQLVSEIIDVRSGSWNLDSVASYLSWETKRRILSIPMGDSWHHDRVVWPWTSNGLYSVRSGYHVLHSTHRALAMGNSHSSHIIYPSRCKAVIEGSTIDLAKVIENALRAQREFIEIRRVPGDDVAVNNILNVHPASWNAPSSDFVKINVDGGWIGDTLKGGVGVVIRNTDGQFVGGLAGPICCDSALAVEAHSAIRGLALSANLGFKYVIVETDSKLLINGINGDFRNKCGPLFPFLRSFTESVGMHEVRWSWVHRDLNRAAHEYGGLMDILGQGNGENLIPEPSPSQTPEEAAGPESVQATTGHGIGIPTYEIFEPITAPEQAIDTNYGQKVPEQATISEEDRVLLQLSSAKQLLQLRDETHASNAAKQAKQTLRT
ncbi:hypothetical protein L3X38_031044 [Prunus dulcis]|uniref:RNase H type-1 domain-containing protein n=1 Tax=Prunus dulcis TaxID=3755 RepID=A0AAD4VCV8_PRUDU|nr:hypothetical protein L3X38_031044 [Prunus dulcis]